MLLVDHEVTVLHRQVQVGNIVENLANHLLLGYVMTLVHLRVLLHLSDEFVNHLLLLGVLTILRLLIYEILLWVFWWTRSYYILVAA